VREGMTRTEIGTISQADGKSRPRQPGYSTRRAVTTSLDNPIHGHDDLSPSTATVVAHSDR